MTDRHPTVARARRSPLLSGLGLGLQLTAALVSLVVLLGSGYAWASFRNFDAAVTHQRFTPGGGTNIDGADQNVLLIGDDSREGASAEALAALGTEANAGNNTDTIMVLHIPANGSQATILSFPRDTLVTIPGHGVGKINAAYNYGESVSTVPGAGATELADTIEGLTGLKIDHFVKVSMFGFYDISVALHGVDVNMCAAQNASTENDDGQHPGGYSGINVHQGWNHIEGKQALAFVRQRHGLAGSDYARIVRQEYFLSAMFRKVATPGTLTNPFKVKRILDAVAGSLVVDDGLRGKGLLSLAGQMQNLTAGRLTFATVPMLGAKSDASGNYLGEAPDTQAMPAFINHMIGRPGPYERAATVPPGTITVTVLNGGQPSGRAGTNAAALKKAGFLVTPVGDDVVTAATTIRYPSGMEGKAKTLAAMVPGAQVTLDPSAKGITLTLGTDGKQVKGVAVAPAPAPATKAPATAVAAPPAGATSAPVVRTADQAGCVN